MAVAHEASGGIGATGNVPRVPLIALSLHFAIMGGVLVAYFFVAFCVARGLLGDVGPQVGGILRAGATALLLAGFVVWIAPLLELPEIWYGHGRAESRVKRGLCPTCGYRLPSGAMTARGAARCPECGSRAIAPPPWQISMRTLRRFVVVGGAAWAIGCAAGATWMLVDEWSFADEASASASHSRARAWPADFARLEEDSDGAIHATTVLESSLDRSWRPAPR